MIYYIYRLLKRAFAVCGSRPKQSGVRLGRVAIAAADLLARAVQPALALHQAPNASKSALREMQGVTWPRETERESSAPAPRGGGSHLVVGENGRRQGRRLSRLQIDAQKLTPEPSACCGNRMRMQDATSSQIPLTFRARDAASERHKGADSSWLTPPRSTLHDPAPSELPHRPAAAATGSASLRRL